MILNIIIWLTCGIAAFFINRIVAFRVEEIFEKKTIFFDKSFFKDNFHNVVFGPIYLISSLFRILFNLDIFEKAKETREYQKKQQKNLKELSNAMCLFNISISQLYNDILLFSKNSNIENNNSDLIYEKPGDVDEIYLNADSSEILKDVEDILGKLDEDEESK